MLRTRTWILSALLLMGGSGCASTSRSRPLSRTVTENLASRKNKSDPGLVKAIAVRSNDSSLKTPEAEADDEAEQESGPAAGSERARPAGPRPDSSGSGGPDQEDTDLSRPRAQRRGEGGGPTSSESRSDEYVEGEEFKSNLLARALGLEESPVSVFGWVQGSYTANPAHPSNHENFGVFPNFKANEWMTQQIFLAIEKRIPTKEADEYGWGFRLDQLAGVDYLQLHMNGFLDGVFPADDMGYEPTQFYGEVHLPWLTAGGIEIKGGRFLSLGGYEDPYAPGRPLHSASYMFSYAQPFTQFGMMSTWHVTDRFNLYNGAVNGWDRWINANYRWGYAGGLSWDSQDEQTNASLTFNFGPNQFPRFFSANYKFTPNGVPAPPFMASRRNVLYNQDNALLITGVVTHEWNDRLSTVVESDYGHESNVPGFGPGGTPANAQWYGIGGWMLYDLDEKWTGVYRAEAFRDENGVRTGFNNTYYETTLGLIWKPRPWLWVRPELRYDWAQGSPVYNDGKSHSQFTFGWDMIFLF